MKSENHMLLRTLNGDYGIGSDLLLPVRVPEPREVVSTARTYARVFQ